MSKQLLLGVDAGAAGETPFDPSSLEGMILWLRASGIVGLSDGDPVTTWEDESGEGNDVSQSTGSKKPTYKTNILNGLPIVRFDGGDGLVTAGALTIPTHTIFAVFRNTANGCLLYEQGPDANSNNGLFLYLDNTQVANWRNDGTSEISSKTDPGDYADNAWRVLTDVYGQSHVSQKIYVNGVDLAASTNNSYTGDPSDMNDNEFHVGSRAESTLFMNGDIAELIVYDIDLSDTDRALVEDYLMDKYAL